jgi:putative (di)nucleoside polyphosphate hydrolase
MSEFSIKNLPYRKAVTGFVVDDKDYFLLVQNNVYKKNEWRAPGGGIKDGEDARGALRRELIEEIGSDNFEIVAESKILDKYDWPENYVKKRMDWRGQIRIQFLVKFTGGKNEICLDKNELKKAKWVHISNIKKYLNMPGQLESNIKALKDFGYVI